MPSTRYPLRVLFLEVTFRCNAYCSFCGSRCREVPCEDELTTEELCMVLDDVAARYDASKIMVNVSGGEPLMRADLCTIMTHAVSLGFHWGLVTNGTLLTQEMVDRLGAAGIRTCSISIDGIGPLHDRIRSFPGAFQRITEGIHRLSKLPTMENIMVSTVVSQQNIDALEEIRDWLCTMPIQTWRVMMVDPIGRAEDNKDLALNKDQVQRYLQFLKESQAMDLPYRVTTACSHWFGKEALNVRDTPFYCYAGKQLCSVLANGDIYVCSDVPKIPELIQGNVRRDSLPDVWENGFQWFRDPESRHTGLCGECAHYPVCRGDSLHTWDFARQAPKFCSLDYGLAPAHTAADDVPCATFQEVLAPYRRQGTPLKAIQIEAQSPTKDRVLVSRDVWRKMQAFFHWGEDAPENKVEQAACLLGQIWRDKGHPLEEAFLVEITGIVPLDTPDAAENTLHPSGAWLQLGYKQAAEQGELLLGFVHSHPGDQTVAMSLGDLRWHKQLYTQDWRTACTMILNPQRQEAAVYTGPAANHTECSFLI